MDDLQCPICGRTDKPEDFRNCNKCYRDVCESCMANKTTCIECKGVPSDKKLKDKLRKVNESALKKAEKVLIKANKAYKLALEKRKIAEDAVKHAKAVLMLGGKRKYK